MTRTHVYDPRGLVEAKPVALAPRLPSAKGLRLAVLDNTKWNANKLLRGAMTQLDAELGFAAVNYYRKESFSKNAAPELLDEIAAGNDLALTAIGD
ncbi:MAG: hypothetical protein VX610_06650 [SAR324 cluster bacterium]|nr:hypothetical protein [SAR324 cluster bacterium]